MRHVSSSGINPIGCPFVKIRIVRDAILHPLRMRHNFQSIWRGRCGGRSLKVKIPLLLKSSQAILYIRQSLMEPRPKVRVPFQLEGTEPIEIADLRGHY
jgi:hypothetical protein